MRRCFLTDYLESLKGEIVEVTKTLDKFFSDKIEQVTPLGPWHKQYYANVKEYLMRGGKRLRPVLVILGYKAVKGDTVPKSLYTAALCVEILHNGSLLHDDLIDHDETRRGGKTFHATYRDINYSRTKDEKEAFDYGMTMSILGGDALINLGASAITAANLDS
ncbi:MAG: Short chain isoprenyl diphosphate synthase, partial [Candidatus Thorarchaeota archaeon AB_25]